MIAKVFITVMLFCFSVLITVLPIPYFISILRVLGQYIGGRLTGYRLCEVCVCRRYYRRENGRLVFKERKNDDKFLLGYCGMIFPKREDDKIPYWGYYLGGHILSFTFIIVLIVLCLVMNWHYIINILLLTVAGWLCFFEMSYVLPLKKHDGDKAARVDFRNGKSYFKTLLKLSKDRALLIEEANNARILEQILNGKKCIDLPDRWFMLPPDTGTVDHTLAANFWFNRLLERHEYTAAQEYGESVMETAGEGFNAIPALKAGMRGELFFLEVIGRRDSRKLLKYFGNDVREYIRNSPESPTVHRFKYAHAKFVTRNMHTATKALQDFERITAEYKFAGTAETERELMENAVNMRQPSTERKLMPPRLRYA